MSPARCSSCDSPAPHLHPAMQFEGEVEVCADDFHLAETPQNTSQYIEAVREKQKAKRGCSNSCETNADD